MKRALLVLAVVVMSCITWSDDVGIVSGKRFFKGGLSGADYYVLEVKLLGEGYSYSMYVDVLSWRCAQVGDTLALRQGEQWGSDPRLRPTVLPLPCATDPADILDLPGG